MHRLVVTALATSALGMGPALADPWPLSEKIHPSSHRLVTPVVQTVHVEAPARRQETRYAAAGRSNLGGGLFEALFGGARNDTPSYQPAAPSYSSYGNNAERGDSEPRAVDPRYLPQVV